ncbi:MAG: Cell division protein FtsL [Acidimicrobiales bacterium]|nr:MAG: hypothetical protein EDR02_08890 [Actinomycetota bacterium]MBV6508757.1 Cell division protein FtsL [Acidimicrobiales bacterium]RIK06506.1 MAG: hypothetical protein DCC48_06215 [Acidobacteriota bacterium]
MTMVRTASTASERRAGAAAPSRGPRPGSHGEAQAPLRLVGRPRKRRARLSMGVLGTVTVVVVFFVLFGLAAFHIFLVQGQNRLDDLGRKRSGAEAEVMDLRYEVAVLESPERIVREAEAELGMVPGTGREYLSPEPVRLGQEPVTEDDPVVGPAEAG